MGQVPKPITKEEKAGENAFEAISKFARTGNEKAKEDFLRLAKEYGNNEDFKRGYWNALNKDKGFLRLRNLLGGVITPKDLVSAIESARNNPTNAKTLYGEEFVQAVQAYMEKKPEKPEKKPVVPKKTVNTLAEEDVRKLKELVEAEKWIEAYDHLVKIYARMKSPESKYKGYTEAIRSTNIFGELEQQVLSKGITEDYKDGYSVGERLGLMIATWLADPLDLERRKELEDRLGSAEAGYVIRNAEWKSGYIDGVRKVLNKIGLKDVPGFDPHNLRKWCVQTGHQLDYAKTSMLNLLNYLANLSGDFVYTAEKSDIRSRLDKAAENARKAVDGLPPAVKDVFLSYYSTTIDDEIGGKDSLEVLINLSKNETFLKTRANFVKEFSDRRLPFAPILKLDIRAQWAFLSKALPVLRQNNLDNNEFLNMLYGQLPQIAYGGLVPFFTNALPALIRRTTANGELEQLITTIVLYDNNLQNMGKNALDAKKIIETYYKEKIEYLLGCADVNPMAGYFGRYLESGREEDMMVREPYLYYYGSVYKQIYWSLGWPLGYYSFYKASWGSDTYTTGGYELGRIYPYFPGPPIGRRAFISDIQPLHFEELKNVFGLPTFARDGIPGAAKEPIGWRGISDYINALTSWKPQRAYKTRFVGWETTMKAEIQKSITTAYGLQDAGQSRLVNDILSAYDIEDAQQRRDKFDELLASFEPDADKRKALVDKLMSESTQSPKERQQRVETIVAGYGKEFVARSYESSWWNVGGRVVGVGPESSALIEGQYEDYGKNALVKFFEELRGIGIAKDGKLAVPYQMFRWNEGEILQSYIEGQIPEENNIVFYIEKDYGTGLYNAYAFLNTHGHLIHIKSMDIYNANGEKINQLFGSYWGTVDDLFGLSLRYKMYGEEGKVFDLPDKSFGGVVLAGTVGPAMLGAIISREKAVGVFERPEDVILAAGAQLRNKKVVSHIVGAYREIDGKKGVELATLFSKPLPLELTLGAAEGRDVYGVLKFQLKKHYVNVFGFNDLLWRFNRLKQQLGEKEIPQSAVASAIDKSFSENKGLFAAPAPTYEQLVKIGSDYARALGFNPDDPAVKAEIEKWAKARSAAVEEIRGEITGGRVTWIMDREKFNHYVTASILARRLAEETGVDFNVAFRFVLDELGEKRIEGAVDRVGFSGAGTIGIIRYKDDEGKFVAEIVGQETPWLGGGLLAKDWTKWLIGGGGLVGEEAYTFGAKVVRHFEKGALLQELGIWGSVYYPVGVAGGVAAYLNFSPSIETIAAFSGQYIRLSDKELTNLNAEIAFKLDTYGEVRVLYIFDDVRKKGIVSVMSESEYQNLIAVLNKEEGYEDIKDFLEQLNLGQADYSYLKQHIGKLEASIFWVKKKKWDLTLELSAGIGGGETIYQSGATRWSMFGGGGGPVLTIRGEKYGNWQLDLGLRADYDKVLTLRPIEEFELWKFFFFLNARF
ncbi:MAG: hypothetical protein QXH27_04080 [Candidatus Micrarchaeia archaeon]